MIYRGPGFLAVALFGSSPPLPSPLSRQQVVSLSQSTCVVCRRSSLLTGEVGGGEWARSQIIRPRESLALYKSISTLGSATYLPLSSLLLPLCEGPEATVTMGAEFVIGTVIVADNVLSLQNFKIIASSHFNIWSIKLSKIMYFR
jgi:hypothetical protein